MTIDRQTHRLNFKWQVSIYFNWPMIGQYDVLFDRHNKELPCIYSSYALNGSDISYCDERYFKVKHN